MTKNDELERARFHAWAINQCAYGMSFSDETRRSYRSNKTRQALKVWMAAVGSKQEEE